MISKAPEFTHSDPDAGPASVFLCYLGDAEICIWIMFSLTFVAGGQIELIKRSWSGASSGLQQICTTLGKINVSENNQKLIHFRNPGCNLLGPNLLDLELACHDNSLVLDDAHRVRLIRNDRELHFLLGKDQRLDCRSNATTSSSH